MMVATLLICSIAFVLTQQHVVSTVIAFTSNTPLLSRTSSTVSSTIVAAKRLHRHYSNAAIEISESPDANSRSHDHKSISCSTRSSNRRSWLHQQSVTVAAAVAGITAVSADVANAGIDPSALQNYSVEGDSSGVQTRLRQIELEKNRPSDTTDQPYVVVNDDVSYREYREGRDGIVVVDGSKIAVEMTIRCKSFSTNAEPGGLKYYATSTDTEFNELAWTVGDGTMSPELESALLGMHKNAVRRVDVKSTAVFRAKKANQLPLPTTKDGKRRFENLFKTDATLLFEVLVTRIK